MAQAQAANHKRTHNGYDGTDIMANANVVIEELGDAPADLDEEDHPEAPTAAQDELDMTMRSIERVLPMTTERDAAGRVGRPQYMRIYAT